MIPLALLEMRAPGLRCSHFFFVPLALPKLLTLGNAKDKRVFLLHSTRFFVTLSEFAGFL